MMQHETDRYVDTDSFIDVLLSHADEYGYSESEAYYEYDQSMEIQVHEGKVSVFESSETSGISFRGKSDKQMGYAFSEELSNAAMQKLLEEARSNSVILETKEPESLYKGDNEYATIDLFNNDLEQKEYDYYADTALSIEKMILQYDPRIIAVDHISISYSSYHLIIRNSLGLDCRQKLNIMSVYANSRSEFNGQTKTGYAFWAGRNPDELNIKEFSSKAALDSLSKLGAQPMKSGKYNVVLDSRASADLLEAFSGIFSADAIQKGFSLLDGRLRQKIASDVITVIDAGLFPESLISVPFDSEGVSTQNTILIENGELSAVLHNRKTAGIDQTNTTGNGFRSGFKGSVSVAPTNMYIVPGKLKKSDLIALAEDGLYITDMSGLHSGVNGISGDYSLSCEGFLIVNGKINRPVDQITIAGNFFSTLENVQSVGSDLFLNPPSSHGSIGSPSLFITDVAISGD